MPLDSWQRSQHKNSAKRDNRPGPVGIHPVAQNRDAEYRDDSSKQGPYGWQPALQHPAQPSTHERCNQNLPDPGMTEKLPGREDQSLPGRIHRHIRGLLDDVEAFEMHPHGVSRIGKPAVSERVRREQIAEFIVKARLRYPEDGYECGADHDDAGADQNDGELPTPGNLLEARSKQRRGSRPPVSAMQDQQEKQGK